MEPNRSPSLKDHLEEMYRTWNRKEFIHPDPLEFVLAYEDPVVQEIVGLVAAGLAYGRVKSILGSLEKVFGILTSPAADLARWSRADLREALAAFRHRWTSGEELADLLGGVGRILEEHGSLERCFEKGVDGADEDYVPALVRFVGRLRAAAGGKASRLLSCPSGGSACKRMFLYLRWMIRRDDVDPGPWRSFAPSGLVVPMDVHMHRVSRKLGLTGRNQADLKCALEVTGFFRRMVPEDPVKYDFALTRPGIRYGGHTPENLEPRQTEGDNLC